MVATGVFDCYKGRLRTTRDDVEAIGLAEHHKCGFLWKLWLTKDTHSAVMKQ